MPKITDPIKLGTMELKNRVVYPSTYVGYADEGGYVTGRLIQNYQEKAKGGAGFILLETTWVREDGKAFPRSLRISSDSHVTGLRELADAIHLAGAKTAVQLGFCGRQGNPRFIGGPPWAPSACAPYGGHFPRVLTTDQCAELADQFALAAGRAKEAGFDAVELHGAHGYLIGQFLSPYTNDRRDRYGNPLAFVTEVYEKSRSAVGPDYPILIRISGDEFLGENGLTLKTQQEKIAPYLERLGICCIDVSAGVYETIHYAVQPLYFPRGVILHLAEGIKQAVHVPVMGAGRVNDPQLAKKAVEDGRVDLIGVCRGMLADPDFPRKAFQGRYEEVRKCIACDSCLDIFPQGSVKCAVNPEQGKEKWDRLRPAPKPKRVLVIGGGVGGMEAARVAALRGHQVTLWEKGPQLGGFTSLASSIPRLYTRELNNIVEWLEGELKRLEVEVELRKEGTAGAVEELEPEVVIVATGSLPDLPAIPGIPGPGVVTLDGYLQGEAQVGQRVAMIGGIHGAELAVSLAREKKEVTLLHEGPQETVGAAPYVSPGRLRLLQEYLAGERVKILSEVRVKRVAEGEVSYIDQGGKGGTLAADTVMVAPSRRPDRGLLEGLRGKVQELYEVGDCVQPRKILYAIHEAYFVAGEL